MGSAPPTTTAGYRVAMSVPASELSDQIVEAYRAHPARGGVDELVDDAGVHPHTEGLAASQSSGAVLPSTRTSPRCT